MMSFLRLAVAAVAIFAAGRLDAGQQATEPSRTENETREASTVPNVIVPHTSEPASRPHGPDVVDDLSDVAVDLMDVGAVVAIPESAAGGALPPEKQMRWDAVVGVTPDEWLVKKPMGPMTALYMAPDRPILIAGVDEVIEERGRRTRRPILLVTRFVKEKEQFKTHDRYPLAFKTVKPGETGLEAGMEIRGGFKSIAEGVKAGTLDVYLEVELPGEEGRTVLVRGTFEEAAIPVIPDLEAVEATPVQSRRADDP